ncbi:MAG TPA: M13 family metallopeptidase [Kofleriaceae bacterium]|jgi:putative endopeptidase|nr:M13 family metallopeptidase [Kofleriaceae bacterium]
MRSTLSILVLTAACGGSKVPAIAPIAAPAAPAAAAAGDQPGATTGESRLTKPVTNQSLASVGLDPGALDRTIDPCDDFYQFACGGWIRQTEIPADKPIAMRSFVTIGDRNLEYEHTLLEQMRAQPGDEPSARQLGTFYASCMDEAAIDKAGVSALRPALAAIDKVWDPRSLTAAIAALQASGEAILFVFGPVQDAADARKVIARIDQGGLGLPDRDYYLSDDESARALRVAYQAYVESILTMIGHPAATRAAADILALETEIAKVSKDKALRRDPRGTYHKIDRRGVAQAMPRFDWEAFFTLVGLKDIKDVTVTSPEFLAGLDALLARTKIETWRAYLAFHLTSNTAPFLTRRLEETQFKFESALTGQPEMPPRWKRCVQHTEDALGDLIGQHFVRDRFGGTSKTWAEDQVLAVVAAMAENLDTVPWMDPATKARAKAKLAAMMYQIGYPTKWKTYPFKLDPRTWTANALAARKAERARQLAKIGKPVDRDDWQMSAPQVNAYYDPQQNAMVFPAGILQPPFYSALASIPVNLGGIGVVVGHELTHGFDDEGAQYDAAGNLVNWWQPDTEQQFRQRTRCVIDQYGGYEVSGNTRLSGANTAGENIADIGGVKLALAAYRQLRVAAPDTVVADGFTEDQQFFLGFGQAWCAKMRPDFEKLLATIDVHAPARWRVNGALSATPEFGKAFRCKAGSKMVPVQPCVVW